MPARVALDAFARVDPIEPRNEPGRTTTCAVSRRRSDRGAVDVAGLRVDGE